MPKASALLDCPSEYDYLPPMSRLAVRPEGAKSPVEEDSTRKIVD